MLGVEALLCSPTCPCLLGVLSQGAYTLRASVFCVTVSLRVASLEATIRSMKARNLWGRAKLGRN